MGAFRKHVLVMEHAGFREFQRSNQSCTQDLNQYLQATYVTGIAIKMHNTLGKSSLDTIMSFYRCLFKSVVRVRLKEGGNDCGESSYDVAGILQGTTTLTLHPRRHLLQIPTYSIDTYNMVATLLTRSRFVATLPRSYIQTFTRSYTATAPKKAAKNRLYNS
jgi:hypothetical protein